MYWKENIWKAENSFSSSIKTNWIGELRSFSWFADEPTKTFTSLICFWSFSDDETLALLIRFWWLAEERPCWLVDLENSQTKKNVDLLGLFDDLQTRQNETWNWPRWASLCDSAGWLALVFANTQSPKSCLLFFILCNCKHAQCLSKRRLKKF